MELMKRFINDEEGQGMVEYALILGLIGLVCIVALTTVGNSVNNIWTNIKTRLATF